MHFPGDDMQHRADGGHVTGEHQLTVLVASRDVDGRASIERTAARARAVRVAVGGRNVAARLAAGLRAGGVDR